MSSSLTGTTALVTGASSGIGSATARRLAELGATVAVVARRQDRLDTLAAEIQQAGGTALVVVADISVRDEAEAAVQQVVERTGRLDIVVNNAGLMLLGPVVGADVEEWERMIAINQKALLYITNAALPHLLKAADDELRGVADIDQSLEFTCPASGRPYVYVPSGLRFSGKDERLVLYDAEPAHNGGRWGIVAAPPKGDHPAAMWAVPLTEAAFKTYMASAKPEEGGS